MRLRRCRSSPPSVSWWEPLVGLAAPSNAGPPGTWTVISGGGRDEHRPARRVPHLRRHPARGDAPRRPRLHRGVRRRRAHQGIREADRPHGRPWTPGKASAVDPKLVAVADGGLRMVFGGIPRPTSTTRTSRGTSGSPAPTRGGTVLDAVPTRAAVAANTGYASSGTGVTALADGTLVAAYPSGQTRSTIRSVPEHRRSFDRGRLLRLRRHAGAGRRCRLRPRGTRTATAPPTWARFVRSIYPTLGPIIQVPRFRLDVQREPRHHRQLADHRDGHPSGGGVYLAYFKGYPLPSPSCSGSYGTTICWKTIPGSAGASHVAPWAAGPGGPALARLGPPRSDDIRAIRTSPSGLEVRRVSATSAHPRRSTRRSTAWNIEGSSGYGPTSFFNDAAGSGTPRSSRGSPSSPAEQGTATRAVEVKLKVTDAGQVHRRRRRSRPRGRKKPCTTARQRRLQARLPQAEQEQIKVKATMDGYAPDKDQAQGHLTSTMDLPRVRRSAMSWRACPNSSRSYVAPSGGSIAPELHQRQQKSAHCSCM